MSGGRPISTFNISTLNDIPKDIVKKYKYAHRFVSLVKSKTPKVL